MGEPGDTLENSEDIQDILSCTSIQRIRRILFTINFPYLDAFTPFTCKESLHQLMAKEQRPYSSSKPFRDISRRLLDRCYLQKLSRYKGSTSFLSAQEQIKPNGYIPWSHQSFASKTFTSSLFLSFYHFMTVRVCHYRAYISTSHLSL